MGDRQNPRHGSMQFWHRKRTHRTHPRVRSWALSSEFSVLGFAGYKAGMTHLIGIDTRKTSVTKDEEIFSPVTVVECPPLKIASARFYKKTIRGFRVTQEIVFKLDKDLGRRMIIPKKENFSELEKINPDDFSDIRILVYTQPRLLGFKKKPDVFEVCMGGSNKEKLDFIKNNKDKELRLESFFKEGDYLDIHSITKGKGIQGPVKRFRVSIRAHKSEKTKRGPGSLGAWCGQAHMMYRVAHAGQMGYYVRTEYNKQIYKLSKNPAEINPAGGFINFGLVKNDYLLIKGSIPGTKKRLIILTKATRIKKQDTPPNIEYISLSSGQG